jgi:hypothetical protein
MRDPKRDGRAFCGAGRHARALRLPSDARKALPLNYGSVVDSSRRGGRGILGVELAKVLELTPDGRAFLLQTAVG